MYEGLLGETIRYSAHNGDEIPAYFARPLGVSNVPGIVVLHHMPGWDEQTKEITRKFAHHGFAAIMPHLHHRAAPGADPDDASAATRAAGGVPDDRLIGDVEAAMKLLRSLPYGNGNIGVIGFCSGGRQSYLCATRIPSLGAAVDCWGGGVTTAAADLTERQPVAPIDLTANINCPLMGIFGNDDQRPSPADVDATEAELKRHSKVYEFHRYDGAGHGFFATNRPGYRPVQCTDAWTHVLRWFDTYLKTGTAAQEPASVGGR